MFLRRLIKLLKFTTAVESAASKGRLSKAIALIGIAKVCELISDRLKMRQWESSDFDIFAEYYSDESNAKYVGGQKTLDEAWRHFALQIGHWHLKGYGYWAVEEIATSNFVGCVGLWKSAGWPELELGYWLLPSMQGKGYAKEAAKKARDFAKEKQFSPTLVSYIDPNNISSIKLAESLGATYENTIELLKHGPHCVYRHF